ncbi:hypothetical protein BKA65DRAFT_539698 [Rhexocercosporidium sp. MPI-PUGE-AT-0058]|nr:hypothetical protein BKA65DRAFT_539698 [Rhexocercosporidium sp. MPI-PUGE-AT-0058]
MDTLRSLPGGSKQSNTRPGNHDANCGEHGAMSMFIEHCPGCQHLRCHDCSIESVIKKQHIQRSSGVKSDTTFHHFYPLWNVPKYPHSSNTKRHSASPNNAKPSHGLPSDQQVRTLLPSKFKFNELVEIVSNNDAIDSSKAPGFISESASASTTLSPLAIAPASTPSPSSSINTAELIDMFDYNSIADESDTDLDIDNMDQSDGSSDSDDSDSGESSLERTFRILSQHLTSFLRHDLDLAARLIPRMRSHLFDSSRENHRYHGASGSSSTSAVSNGESGSASGSSSRMTQQSGARGKGENALKHNRENDDPNDDPNEGGRSDKAKRLRRVPFGQTPLFACHFRKKDPERFGDPQSRWYKYCSDPCSSDLRRIKDHFNKRHRLSQCQNCLKQFIALANIPSVASQPCDGLSNRVTDRVHSNTSCIDEGFDSKAPEEDPEQLPGCCHRPQIVGSDIDGGQWEHIQKELSKKGKNTLQKLKTDFEKWYVIWEILFPAIPAPANPWAESSVVVAQTVAPVVDRLAEFERFIEAKIKNGVSRQLFQQMQQVLAAFKRSVAQESAPQGAHDYATFEYYPYSSYQTSQAMEGISSTEAEGSSSSSSTSPSTALRNALPDFNASNSGTFQQGGYIRMGASPARPVYLPIQSDFHQPSSESGPFMESQPFQHSLPQNHVAVQAPQMREPTPTTIQHADFQIRIVSTSGTGLESPDTEYDMSASFNFEQELDFMIAHSTELVKDPNEPDLDLWQYSSGL